MGHQISRRSIVPCLNLLMMPQDNWGRIIRSGSVQYSPQYNIFILFQALFTLETPMTLPLKHLFKSLFEIFLTQLWSTLETSLEHPLKHPSTPFDSPFTVYSQVVLDIPYLVCTRYIPYLQGVPKKPQEQVSA